MSAYATVSALSGRDAARPAAMVVISGHAGMGKTAVMADATHTMLRHGARLGVGKFNQFGDGRPLWALSQALDHLVARLVREEPAHRNELLCERLRVALAEHAQLVIDAVPRLALLLGPQPAAPALSGEANRVRFEMLLRRFVGALALPDSPVVLVLDDLQWADEASLTMLRSMLRDPDIANVLLLTAYRTEAVDDAHPLHELLRRIEDDGIAVQRLDVTGWTRENIAQMLRLSDIADERDALAKALHRATRGSPLGVIHALREAFDSGLLSHLPDTGRWQPNTDVIDALLRSAPASAIAQRQLGRLPKASREAMTTGALLGARFELATLGRALDVSSERAAELVWPALCAGLLRPADAEIGKRVAAPAMEMSHDIVQQAAHALAATNSLASRHAHIGRALLGPRAIDALPADLLYEVALHVNQGGATVDSPVVLELNLRAGLQARQSGAVAASKRHFDRAYAVVDAGTWQRSPALAFQVGCEATEAAYLVGDYARLDAMLHELATHCTDALDTVRVTELRIQGLLARNRLAEALAEGEQALVQALALLDVRLEPLIDPAHWPAVPAIESLAAPAASPPQVDAALRVLVWLTPYAYITSFETYVRVTLTMIALARAHPGSPLTAIAYTNYGLVLCGTGHLEAGFAAGELALALNERATDPTLRSKVMTLTHGFLRHWKLSADCALEPLLDTVRACSLCGDQEYLGYASFLYCDKAWGIVPLDRLEITHARHTALARQFGHEFSSRHCEVWLQAIRALRGETRDALHLRGDAFDEARDIALLVGTDNRIALFTTHTLRGWLAWHRGDRAEALAACRAAEPYAPIAAATLLTVDHLVLWSLCELTLLPSDGALRDAALARVNGMRDRLSSWAQAAPANVQHRLLLVQALLDQVRGVPYDAWLGIERAIEAADASVFLHDRAVTAEIAGEFFLALDQRPRARALLQRAVDHYREWGGLGAMQALLARQAWLLDEAPPLAAPVTEHKAGMRAKLSALLDAFGLDRIVVLMDDAPSAIVAERAGSDEILLERLPPRQFDALREDALLREARGSGAYRVHYPPADAQQPLVRAVWPVTQGRRCNGVFVLEARGQRLLSPSYVMPRLPAHVQSVVDELRAEQLDYRLRASALTDADTGLPNRSAFVRSVDLTLARMRGVGNQQTAVALIALRGAEEWPVRSATGEFGSAASAVAECLTTNARAAGFLACLSPETFGLLYWEVRPETIRLECSRLLERLRALPAPLDATIVIRADDGEMSAVSAIRDAQASLAWRSADAPGGVVWYDPYVQRLRGAPLERAQKLLQEQSSLRALAEQRNQAKSRFLAAAAHDLQQPLQSMSMLLEPAYQALRAGQLRVAEAYLQDLRRSVYQLREQLSSVLDVSRLESGLIQPEIEAIVLEPLLRDVAAQTAPYASSVGVEVLLDPPAGPEWRVQTDRQLLQRLLANLISNSIRYRNADPKRPAQVRVATRFREGMALIEVIDNGIGIEQELIDSGAIFRPFYQVHPRKDSGADRGVGLGLSIVRSIVELLPQHTLEVHSKLGHGTRFALRLPCSRLTDGVLDAALDAAAQAEVDLSDGFFILVDDDEDPSQALEAALAAAGALHARASNLAELDALLAGLDRQPDALITEWMLRHSGTSAIAAYNCVADAFGPVPTIVFAAHTDEIELAPEATNWQVCPKSDGIAALLRRLAGILDASGGSA